LRSLFLVAASPCRRADLRRRCKLRRQPPVGNALPTIYASAMRSSKHLTRVVRRAIRRDARSAAGTSAAAPREVRPAV